MSDQETPPSWKLQVEAAIADIPEGVGPETASVILREKGYTTVVSLKALQRRYNIGLLEARHAAKA